MTRLGRIAYSALLVAALFASACAGTQPPERLVGVTSELGAAEAQELAEFQPALLREAREQRDAAWAAVEDGNEERAEVHAWTAWLRLRTAANLEALAQADAARRVAGGESPSPEWDSSTGAIDPNVANVPTGANAATGGIAATPGGAPGRSTAPAAAIQAVREAEDARLRLLAAGLRPDLRWSEAEALLQTAQRALERQEYSRAEELGQRAAFVFEVVRLTRLGETAMTPMASVTEPAPTAPVPVTPEPGQPQPQVQTPAAVAPTVAPTPGPTAAVDPPPVAITPSVPAVVVVPDTTPAPPAVEPEPEVPDGEPARSRIISNILQPVDY